MGKILVACEESQAVTIELREMGHEAYSCDILPCSGGHPEWHLQTDVIPLLNQKKWDMIIAFPPCTYLTVSGNRWFDIEKYGINARIRKVKRLMAIKFFMSIANANCGKIAIENPIGTMSKQWRKPNQIIQPWMFGEDASKQTCLWLKNLPILEHGKIIPPKGFSLVKYAHKCSACPDCGEPFCDEHEQHYFECPCIGPDEDDIFIKTVNGYDFCTRDESIKPLWSNQTSSGQNKLGPSPERARLRSKTYSGIAKALATQWGPLIKP